MRLNGNDLHGPGDPDSESGLERGQVHRGYESVRERALKNLANAGIEM
jgi:hypothetical protein